MRVRYLVVYEKGPTNHSAYGPDLPGCVAAGTTLEETRENMRGAIELHLAGLRQDGLPVPDGRGADEAGAEILEVA
jgi:predicted RNase H-like HicB family nuclease